MKRVSLAGLFFLGLLIVLTVNHTNAQNATTYTELKYSKTEVVLNKDQTELSVVFYFVDPKQDDKQLTTLSERGTDYTEKLVYTWIIDGKAEIIEVNNRCTVTGVNEAELRLYVGVYWNKATMKEPVLRVSTEPINGKWWVG